MHTLIADNWRVHVVAHSHGGNVLLEALDIGAEGFTAAHDYEDGYLVLMGTPILELRELAKVGMSAQTIAWKVLLWAAISAGFVYLAWPTPDGLLPHGANALSGGYHSVEIAILATILVFAFLTALYFARLLLYGVLGVPSSAGSTFDSQYIFIKFRDALSTQWKRLLILNSDVDEAYQVLSKLAVMVPAILKPAAAESTTFREWLGGVASFSHYADQVNFGKRRRGVSG
jgi:hypothetical protein